MITVFRFQVFDQSIGRWIMELSKGTASRVAALKGRVVEGSDEQVAPSMIDDEGRYVPFTR